MAITHVDTNTTSNAAGGVTDTLTVTKPTGTAADDLLVCCLYKAADSVHVVNSVPSGWTLLDRVDTTNLAAEIYTKWADGAEGADYTWTLDATGICGAAVTALRGASPTGYIHGHEHDDNTVEDPIVAPTLATGAPCNILTFVASRDDSTTEVTHTPSSTVLNGELADWGNDGGASTRNGAVYMSGPMSPGASRGGLSVDPSGSVTNSISFTVALKIKTPETAVTQVGSTTTAANTAGGGTPQTLTASVPTGTQWGDVMIAWVCQSQSTDANPGGWTLLHEIDGSTQLRGRAYYRMAQDEPADYSWAMPSANTHNLSITTFRGVDLFGGPIDTSAATGGTTGDPDQAPSITLTRRCMLITLRGSNSSTTTEMTHSSRYTELADFGADNGSTARTQFVAMGWNQDPIGSASRDYIDAAGGTQNALVVVAIGLPVMPAQLNGGPEAKVW